MIGGLFAGTDERPRRMVLYQGGHISLQGDGFSCAMEAGSKDRYAQEELKPKNLCLRS